MKLQTAIVAPHAARVAEVCLHAGASFDHGAALVRLEAHVEEEGEEK
jgi:biotin carboxyl carrier protein